MQSANIEGLHGLRHVAMSCIATFLYIGGKRVWRVNGMERIVRVYQRSPEPDMNLKCCKRV